MSSVLGFIKAYHPKAMPMAQKYIGTSEPLEPLGAGIAGAVFKTPNSTAVKVHKDPQNFLQELRAYQRLTQYRVREVQGFSVPQLVNSDRRFLLIEMSIVSDPFLVDFAGSRLDHKQDFSPEVMADWWERMEERFGDRIPIVQSVYYELIHRYGLYYGDFKPGNIEFEREKPRT